MIETHASRGRTFSRSASADTGNSGRRQLHAGTLVAAQGKLVDGADRRPSAGHGAHVSRPVPTPPRDLGGGPRHVDRDQPAGSGRSLRNDPARRSAVLRSAAACDQLLRAAFSAGDDRALPVHLGAESARVAALAKRSSPCACARVCRRRSARPKSSSTRRCPRTCTRSTINHPVLGSNTIPQLFCIMIAHENRHHEQMARVQASPGFPRD